MNNPTIQWPGGRRAAVSLSYDDGVVCHPAVVAPQLEGHGLRGTFYAPLRSDLMQHPFIWREMVQRGHELGNHTVFHPCRNCDGRYSDWLREDLDLQGYSSERWLAEVKAASDVLTLVDGKQERTFGNTCFDNWIGPEDAPVSLEPLAKQLFLAARGEVSGRPVNLTAMNFYNLGTVWADRRSFEDFSQEFEEIMDTGGWVVYTFHGVGEGSHNHYINEAEHLKLLAFLREKNEQIWTAPIIEVVKFLRQV